MITKSSGPLFSVVVPAFNAERTISATIESVLAQTVVDFELIVVDDGSTDATAEIARAFERDRRVQVYRQQNQGTAGARNSGIGRSRGEFISFLDHDDLWMPTYLEAMASTLRKLQNPGFAYADGWILDDVSRRVRTRTALEKGGVPSQVPSEPRELLMLLIERTFIRSATTVPRSVLDTVGGFDTTLSGVDDFDLWVRILAAGYEAAQASGMLLVFRDGPDSLSKQGLLMIEGRREVLRRIATRYEVSPEVREKATAQIPALERLAAAMSGRSRTRGLLLRARLRLGVLYRAMTSRRRYRRTLPPEITAVFGDLESL